MEKEQVTGRLDELKGKVKERIGKATDNPRLEDEGALDEAKGKVKQAYGNVKDTIKKADKNVGSDVNGR